MYDVIFSVIYLVRVGFPVPYIGFLSHEGSFSPMVSPILIPNHMGEKVLASEKLPSAGIMPFEFSSYDWCKR